MKVSIAAKSTALESLVAAALSNPGDLPKHVDALGGLQLFGESSDEVGEKGERYAKAVDSVFSAAFRVADRPQVRHAFERTGVSQKSEIAHPTSCFEKFAACLKLSPVSALQRYAIEAKGGVLVHRQLIGRLELAC